MFDTFSHYLSYGATDQVSARELSNSYDGLVVPGTIAAFQSAGTKGFVLTLSATSSHTKYVVDSRFPLFQQRLPSPKKSHESLADGVFHRPELIQPFTEPRPDHFPDEVIDALALNWLEFNGDFRSLSSKHFSKYAERLGEEVVEADTAGPEYVLPPYFVAPESAHPWWERSDAFWRHSVAQVPADSSAQLIRVVASTSGNGLATLLDDVPEEQVVVWVSGLNELDLTTSGPYNLIEYGRAIAAASSRDKKKPFALYGGFFSVLLSTVGLRGSSHGIGYGESRAWEELPSSGPPPARFYLPLAHRYVSLDLALLFWREDRSLVLCECTECGGRSPAALDYHGLMRHSVHCRAQEITEWSGRPLTDAADELDRVANDSRTRIAAISVPKPLRNQANSSFAHLPAWAMALRAIAGP